LTLTQGDLNSAVFIPSRIWRLVPGKTVSGNKSALLSKGRASIRLVLDVTLVGDGPSKPVHWNSRWSGD